MWKYIFRIAKVELLLLFYSPIAWLLLLIFALQAGLIFSDNLNGYIVSQEMGKGFEEASLGLFGGSSGVFSVMQGYLYFYIPLLTMGLVSRELSSGSIKLLYSSPISNFQIIIGKYVSILVYGFLMICVLLIFVFCAWGVVKDFNLSAVLVGLLGIYLLLCAYAAIGIFMSSLTNYQIVAALGTLIVLMLLRMVSRWGQEYDIVRDVTYWLSINGRSGTFIRGMICSEDLLYFFIVIALFLSLTIIRLNAVRQKIPFTVTLGKNVGVILLTCLLGYFTSLPLLKVYYDATTTKINTLTPNSQKIIEMMNQGLTITTYVNVMDNAGFAKGAFIKPDEQRFEQYLRFKPDIKMKYVYYYDSVSNFWIDRKYPDASLREKMRKICESNDLDSNKFLLPEEIRSIIDLSGEGYRFVRQLETSDGKKTWLRIYDDFKKFPEEREITAAFKRLVMELPVVGFVAGNGTRTILGSKDIDYSRFAQAKSFRNALINQGFETRAVYLSEPIPAEIDILVIADPRDVLNEEENENLERYIAEGKNMMILGEPKRREIINSLFDKFGVEMLPGTLVKYDTLRQSADVVPGMPTQNAAKCAYEFGSMLYSGSVLGIMNGGGLKVVEDKGFNVMEFFKTPSKNVWNELENTVFVDEIIKLNPEVGEVEQAYPVLLGLSRNVNGKEQKIILSGDADCISNIGLKTYYSGMRASNFTLITGGFYWLSDSELPIDVRRPPLPDNEVYIGNVGGNVIKWMFTIILPFLLAASGLFSWLRRKGR